MIDRDVTIYISEGCIHCADLLEQMDEWEVPYRTKNISENSDYLQELQSEGIYGTPATFIEGELKPVLGFQKNQISHILGVGMKTSANIYFPGEDY